MKHEVKVGDRFRLGAWEWEVLHVQNALFKSYTHKDEEGREIWLWVDDASSIDWIKPEVRFTKEQENALIEQWTILSSSVHFRDKTAAGSRALLDFHSWINAHTEKEV